MTDLNRLLPDDAECVKLVADLNRVKGKAAPLQARRVPGSYGSQIS